MFMNKTGLYVAAFRCIKCMILNHCMKLNTQQRVADKATGSRDVDFQERSLPWPFGPAPQWLSEMTRPSALQLDCRNPQSHSLQREKRGRGQRRIRELVKNKNEGR